jgi:hypothetical protein
MTSEPLTMTAEQWDLFDQALAAINDVTALLTRAVNRLGELEDALVAQADGEDNDE